LINDDIQLRSKLYGRCDFPTFGFGEIAFIDIDIAYIIRWLQTTVSCESISN